MMTHSPFGGFIRTWWLDILLLLAGAGALAMSFVITEPPFDPEKGNPALALRLVALAFVTAWLLFRVPRWQVGGLRTESAPQRLVAENEARRTLATIFGGAALLAGLYFTSVQVADQRKQAVVQSEQAIVQLKEQRDRAAEDRSLSERRLITETYVKAVELLRQIDGRDLGTKIGAIYALEEIAKSSASLHRPIMELLQAYVKERSPLETEARPAPRDVQAAITVMGRRQTKFDGPSPFAFELSRVNLRHVRFDGLNFEYANFAGANVSSGWMIGTMLCGANFRGANMSSVEVVGADVRLAYLDGPSFIKDADLRGAVLMWPDQLRYWDGKFDAAAILGADLSTVYADKIRKGGGDFADDASGTSKWRAHMRKLLGANGRFEDGCGKLPTPAWTLVNDPAPLLFSK